MGLRFDTVVVCYILILPLLVVVVSSTFGFFRKWLYWSIHLWFCFFLSVILMLCAANVPYFDQFFKNINASVWNWIGEPAFVVGMITKDRSFFFFSMLCVVLVILFCFLLYRLYRYFLNRLVIAKDKKRFDGKVFLVGIICLTGCFVGIRGRIAVKSPIRIGTAYFCNDPFLNQMGLNPAFVFLRTTLDSEKNKRKEISLMDNERALENARRYLGITDTFCSESPIARVIPGKEHSDQNVILIMVESLRSNLLGQGEKRLVPYLDTLVTRSTYFPRFYSSGIHTMNGVYSCLFGFPALLDQHPFKTGDILTYESLPVVLKKKGIAHSTLPRMMNSLIILADIFRLTISKKLLLRRIIR